MNRNIRLIRPFILLLIGVPIAFAQVHMGKLAQANNDSKLERYVQQVAELSSRARANVYFPNPQSIFQGVQVNFVNVGTGNLTFFRRDMVVSGPMPLVLARVYDSASTGSTDFGPGWILSAAETIAVSDDAAQLSSEGGSVIEFVKTNPNTFVLKEDRPSDYLQLVQTAPDIAQVHLRSGMVKEYKQIGNLYRLTTVTDSNGNQIRLTYSSRTISRIENQSHFLEFTRNEKGRIIAAQDDQGRKVQYIYDEKGILIAVDDLGGNRWRYSYSGDGRLKRAVDPLQRENFSVDYEGTGRVRRLRLPSGVIHYSYDIPTHLTTVRDRKELISRYFQNEEGITTRAVNALGEETSIVLDGRRNVTGISRNGTAAETMEYDQQHRLLARHNLGSSGTTDFHYSYDPQTGLLSRLQGSDGTSRIFSYDSAGRLIGADLPDGDHSYIYSSSGDLSGFSAGNVNLSFSLDSDGLIVSMNEGKGRITKMTYRAGGELAQTTFSDGEMATYEYQPSGLRTKSAYLDGRRVQYSYDPAGNLAGTKVFDATGKQTAGQTLTMDDSYQLVRWTLFDGTEHTFQYDPNGNLTEWKGGKSVTRFEYDELNRIVAVITPDGQRLTYTYKAGEHSLIEQYDHASIAIADLRDTGSTFAPQSAVMATRPLPAMLGSVRFSETLGTFQLANSDGTEIVTPDGAIEQPLLKMRLVAGGTPLRVRQAEFSRPFNTMFMPGEYASINCCPLCTINGRCPPGCDNGGNSAPVLNSISQGQAAIDDGNVSETLSGTFNDTQETILISGSGVSAKPNPATTDGTTVITSFVIDANNATVGNYSVKVKDSGGTSGPVTFTVRPAMTVNGSNDVNAIFVGSDPALATANTFIAQVQPTGGTFTPSSSDGNDAFMQGTLGGFPTVSIKSSDQSAANGDRTLTFKYTVNSVSATQTNAVTARKFAFATNANPSNTCSLGNGFDDSIVYTPFTHPDGTAVPPGIGLDGTSVTESFTPVTDPNPCNYQTGNGNLDANSQFSDRIAQCSTSPIPACSSTTTQSISVAGFPVRSNKLVITNTSLTYTSLGPTQ